MIIHDALKPLPERRSAEIHEQPKGLLRQAKIGQQLLSVDRRQAFYGLHFDNQATADPEISPASIGYNDTFEPDGQYYLPLDIKPRPLERICENGFVNRFQQSRTEFSMNSQRCVNGDSSKLFSLTVHFASFAASREPSGASLVAKAKKS